jgi:predicted CXXCH cytochrome family protein
MKRQALIVSFLIFGLAVLARSEKSTCIKCHLSSDLVSDTTVAAVFIAGDIHQSSRLDCSDCHGGNPKAGFTEQDPGLAMDPAKGYKAPPSRVQMPEFCARCHSDIEYMKKYNPKLPTDQLQLYKTSGHGKSLYQKGDTLVAVCTDCHGVHGLLPPSDSRSKVYHNNIPNTCKNCHSDSDRMKAYRYKGKPFPTDQYSLYSQSIHGIMVLQKDDKSAPACNNCHGNHGASPPNLASVSAACGECHANNRDFFNQSPHKVVWDQKGLPECEQCHSNHLIKPASDQMLGVGEGSLCIECHKSGTGGYVVAARLKLEIDSLRVAISSTEDLISEAEKKGAMGGEGRYNLNSAKDALTRIRSVIHTSDTLKVGEILKPALLNANDVALTAKLSLRDLRARQIGLGISLVLVLWVVYALFRKIRQVDNKKNFIVKD